MNQLDWTTRVVMTAVALSGAHMEFDDDVIRELLDNLDQIMDGFDDPNLETVVKLQKLLYSFRAATVGLTRT